VEILAVAVNSEAAHQGVQICERLLDVNGVDVQKASLSEILILLAAM
jgi:hypothetical protein